MTYLRKKIEKLLKEKENMFFKNKFLLFLYTYTPLSIYAYYRFFFLFNNKKTNKNK